MKIIILGGGAAGIFTAIRCKSLYPNFSVTVLEKRPVILTKVKISGGGRCNVTHACFDARSLTEFYPRGSKALQSVFSRFQPSDTVTWFETRGVALKTEKDNRMFPVTDDSQTIIDCLLNDARSLGVSILTKRNVLSVDELDADRIVLATGSSPWGYEVAVQLGHTIVKPVPSLFTFSISDPQLTALAGVAVTDAVTTLPELKLKQAGPVLITHWGVSGPGIIKLSAWGARELYEKGYQTPLKINWIPSYSISQIETALHEMRQLSGTKRVRNTLPFSEIPTRLWAYLLQKSGISEEITWATVGKTQINKLVENLSQCAFMISGKGQFKDEFVTCGGVALNEVDFKTMESKIRPGLFFAGEVLDIDGITGGFNFQNAWSTGWIAGEGVGR
jgi:predicted Rossmann fold flavoprotein